MAIGDDLPSRTCGPVHAAVQVLVHLLLVLQQAARLVVGDVARLGGRLDGDLEGASVGGGHLAGCPHAQALACARQPPGIQGRIKSTFWRRSASLAPQQFCGIALPPACMPLRSHRTQKKSSLR